MAILTMHGDLRSIEKVKGLFKSACGDYRAEEEYEGYLIKFAQAIRDRKDPLFLWSNQASDSPKLNKVVSFASSKKIQINLRPHTKGVVQPSKYVDQNGSIIQFSGDVPSVPINELTHICGLHPAQGQSQLRKKIDDLRKAAGSGLPPFNPSEEVREWALVTAARIAVLGHH